MNKEKLMKELKIFGFESNLEPNPTQRAYHNTKTGKIVIYTQFPGVSTYLGESLEKLNTPQGKMLLCEIVCEAMFRRIAKEQLSKGKALFFGESDVDGYLNLIDELQKKHLNKIYNLIMNCDFGNKESDKK